jgi:hypothetical protein
MRIIRILEIAWLVIAIGGIIIGTFMFYTKGWDEAVFFYIFTLVAAIFYYIRRRQRIKMEQESRPEE